MPFIGRLSDGDFVSPKDVSGSARVTCPGCEGEMRIRKAHYNSGNRVPRHFYHSTGGCEGESEIHKRMKAVAQYYLEERFPDADVQEELHLDGRFADVAATFDEPRFPYGNGMIIEVQFKNKGKDIGQVTREFLDHGYSVLWAYLSDFQKESLYELEDFEVCHHRFSTVWPDNVPSSGSWSGYQQPYVDEILDVDRSVPIKFPTNFYDDFLFNMYSPENIEPRIHSLGDRLRSGPKIWVQGKGRSVFWFQEFMFDSLPNQLVASRYNKETEEHDFVSLDGVASTDHLREYAQGVADIRDSNSSDPDFSVSWRTGRGISVIRLSTDDRGKYHHEVEFRGRHGNSVSLSKEYRSGDEYRILDSL